jgi:hypothetical protein
MAFPPDVFWPKATSTTRSEKKMAHVPALLAIWICSSLATLYLIPAPDPLVAYITFAIVFVPQAAAYFFGDTDREKRRRVAFQNSA